MSTPSEPNFYEDSPDLFLFTSLTAGSSHIITATSRMETILKANRVPFKAVDCATDEKARRIWGRRAMGKKLPGLVREAQIVGDLDMVEEWNEFGELKQVLKDIPGVVQAKLNMSGSPMAGSPINPITGKPAGPLPAAVAQSMPIRAKDVQTSDEPVAITQTQPKQGSQGSLANEAAAAAALMQRNRIMNNPLTKKSIVTEAPQEKDTVAATSPTASVPTSSSEIPTSPPAASTSEESEIPQPLSSPTATATLAHPAFAKPNNPTSASPTHTTSILTNPSEPLQSSTSPLTEHHPTEPASSAPDLAPALVKTVSFEEPARSRAAIEAESQAAAAKSEAATSSATAATVAKGDEEALDNAAAQTAPSISHEVTDEKSAVSEGVVDKAGAHEDKESAELEEKFRAPEVPSKDAPAVPSKDVPVQAHSGADETYGSETTATATATATEKTQGDGATGGAGDPALAGESVQD